MFCLIPHSEVRSPENAEAGAGRRKGISGKGSLGREIFRRGGRFQTLFAP